MKNSPLPVLVTPSMVTMDATSSALRLTVRCAGGVYRTFRIPVVASMSGTLHTIPVVSHILAGAADVDPRSATCGVFVLYPRTSPDAGDTVGWTLFYVPFGEASVALWQLFTGRPAPFEYLYSVERICTLYGEGRFELVFPRLLDAYPESQEEESA